MAKKLSMLPNVSLDGASPTPLNLNMGAPFAPQVQAYIESLGESARGVSHLAIVGQAVAAGLVLPAMEMLGGLPSVALLPMGQKEPAGWLPTADFRHNTCRAMREEAGPVPAGYTVIDGGGRGLTPAQLEELAALLGCEVGEIHVSSTNPGQVNIADLGGQAGVDVALGIKSALQVAGFPVAECDTSRLLFVPAGAGIVGLVQALALHGFTGAWPRTVRLAGTPATGFKVAEVTDPQAMRQWAVQFAASLDAKTAPVLVPRALLRQLLVAAYDGGATTEYDEGCALIGEKPRG